MNSVTPSLLILYGSQTGTAEDIARRIFRQAKRRYLNVQLSALDELEFFESLPKKCSIIVFIMATAGQGEFPDNAQRFWRFLLKKSLPIDFLHSIKFALLGLGDSSYSKFNFSAKKLHRRLKQLGAENVQKVALADEQDEFGCDSVADTFINELWQSLGNLINLDNRFLPIYKALPATYKITRQKDDVKFIQKKIDTRMSFEGRIFENTRLTPPNHFQDTRLIKIAYKNLPVSYKPGDVVILKPHNLKESIDIFKSVCPDLDYETPFLLYNTDTAFLHYCDDHEKAPVNFRTYLEQYLDLQIVPKRSFFEQLSYFAVDEREREKLQEFSDSKNATDLTNYTCRARRTVAETVRDFAKTCKLVPLEYWFDLLSPIRPRHFSIASSPKAHPGEIHILLAVVNYKNPLMYDRRLGLCSNWLARQPVDQSIEFSIGPGSFNFPTNQNTPCLLIGPGTGVAPFRSFLFNTLQQADLEKFCHHVLFFGCRNRQADFYFEKEWTEDFRAKLLTVFATFSRDQKEKVYVQHKIEHECKVVADLVYNQRAWVFIAGNAKQMPEQVKAALKKTLLLTGHLKDENSVEEYFLKMEKERRLQLETWS